MKELRIKMSEETYNRLIRVSVLLENDCEGNTPYDGRKIVENNLDSMIDEFIVNYEDRSYGRFQHDYEHLLKGRK